MIAAIIHRGHFNIIIYNLFDDGKSLYGDVQVQEFQKVSQFFLLSTIYSFITHNDTCALYVHNAYRWLMFFFVFIYSVNI